MCRDFRYRFRPHLVSAAVHCLWRRFRWPCSTSKNDPLPGVRSSGWQTRAQPSTGRPRPLPPREAGRPRDSPLGAVGCSCCTLPRAVRDGPPGRKTSKLLDEDLTSGASIKLNGRLLLRPPFASFTWPAILLPLSSERRPDPNHLTRRAAPCEQKCKEVI